MGEMKRQERQRKKLDRFVSTLVIATSIIAAVRLARESDNCPPITEDSIGDRREHSVSEDDFDCRDPLANRRNDDLEEVDLLCSDFCRRLREDLRTRYFIVLLQLHNLAYNGSRSTT